MIKLSGILGDSIVDGPGIRTTVFAQGCPHRCPGCHNPETWPFEGGTAMEEEQILAIVRSNPLCRGVTFSGGEPFAQADGFARLGELLKQAGYEVAAYTGYTLEELMAGTPEQRQLLDTIDVLIDGPFRIEARTLSLPFRGSANQRILNVPASLEQGTAVEVTAGRLLGQY